MEEKCEHSYFTAFQRTMFVDWYSCAPFKAVVTMRICDKCGHNNPIISDDELLRVRREIMTEDALYKNFGVYS